MENDSHLEHTVPSGRIEKWEATVTEQPPQRADMSYWRKISANATCELVVVGKQINKHAERRGIYAVTSAHLLFGTQVEQTIRSTFNSDEVRSLVKGHLKTINANIYREIYRLCITEDGEKLCDFSYPPLVCYRYYQLQNPNRIMEFGNDIALFPIESDCFGNLGHYGRHEILTHVSSNHLADMARKRTPVYVKGKVGIVVPMQQAVRRDLKIGFTLAFTLNNG